MTESGTDHRRKRSPTPPFSSKELSRFALPLVLSACLIVSVLLTFTIDDTSSGGQRDQRSRRLDVFRNPHIQQQQQRALLDGVGGDADVGLDENVWHRQLRAMKGEVRKQDRRNRPRRTRKTPHADESSRSMAAAAEDWTEAYAGGDRMRRMAVIPRYQDKHHFDECVGKTIVQCQSLIDSYVAAHPDEFNGRSTLYLDVRKIRELTDESYYKVVLRTNVPGTRVMGLFDDSMVYYPWKWRVNGADRSIGPWSCKEDNVYLEPGPCCLKIQQTVPEMDDAGNYLACFVEEPVGGPNNPERDDRAIVVTDPSGKVVRAPVAH